MARIRGLTRLTGAMVGVLLLPANVASADTYTIRWTWEVPHVAVGSPTAFTVAAGDVIVTEEDLGSERLLGRVGVLTVTAELSASDTPPVGQRTACPTGDGVVFTLPDVSASTYVEASFVREGTLEVLAGPHGTGTGSGGPMTFRICGPVGTGLADVVGGPAPDDPDPDPQPEPEGDADPATCGVPPRAAEAEGRGSPCPPTREGPRERGR